MKTFFVLMIYAINSFVFSQTLDLNKPKILIAKPTHTPNIDGIIENYEWSNSNKGKDFIQKEPFDGISATEKTEIYVLYDEQNLYLAIKCFDKNPNGIATNFSSRDSYGTADYVGFMLDTFNDKLNAYYFAITAAGTKIDGKYSNDKRFKNDWDGVWYGEANLTDYGWSAEFKIPFSTLQFETNTNQWGFNAFRNISRKREISYWQYQSRNNGVRVSKSGVLKNLLGIKAGSNLQFIPYLTSAIAQDRVSKLKFQNNNGVTGLDIKYAVTSNLDAVATINPDFAQIEADEEVINLSRYPVYLREKRPFFLEGSNYFRSFGGGHGRSIFYSRRINEPIYGVKLNGKLGEWSIGLLNTLNDNDIGVSNKIRKGEISNSINARASYNILSLRRDILENSQIGIVAMSKDFSGSYNRIFGVDAQLRLGDYDRFSAQATFSFENKFSGNNQSISLSYRRATDLISYSANYAEQGENFMGNEIGFNRYNNFREIGLGFRYGPRFEEIGLRRVILNINAFSQNFHTLNFFNKNTLSRNVSLWGMVQFMNYWAIKFSYNYGKEYDRFDKVLYPKNGFSIGFDTNNNDRLYLDLGHRQGKYRTGYNWSYNGRALFRPSDKFNLEVNYNYSLVKLLSSKNTFEYSTYEVFRSKFFYYFTRDFNARLILQYNRLSNRLDAYFLFSYRFQPGSAIYLAYNERFDSQAYTENGVEIYPKFGSSHKILQLKFSYLFQL